MNTLKMRTEKIEADDKEESLNEHLKTDLEVIVSNGTMKKYF